MMRHRAGDAAPQEPQGSSSSSDDDAFSAFSRKRKGKKGKAVANPVVSKKANTSTTTTETTHDGTAVAAASQQQQNLPALATSSTKRHHGAASDARKAKMDAVLMELELEKSRLNSRPPPNHHRRSGASGRNNNNHNRGSFVDPGDELLTTNVFVGNLATTITEEQVTQLFQQFGDLYSVKIMWPRNAEERSRNRHTGFVCFQHRQDAEEAIRACNESDPFKVGRPLMMRWGKNVKKMEGGVPIVKRGVGNDFAAANAPISYADNLRASRAISTQHKVMDDGSTIRVVQPSDKSRAMFISTVASFVAKDGAQLETTLLHREINNPAYRFLTLPSPTTTERKEEHIYYKWRVYSFCQGDSLHSWRVEPFVMFQEPKGCLWIPPQLDMKAARQESERHQHAKEESARQQIQRRSQHPLGGLSTGRQLEQARRGRFDEGDRLSSHDQLLFDKLCKQQLCASRESIAEAMAYCFEKSGAAKQISSLLKDLFSQELASASLETMTARLFLVSDVLFNSQQPGIRNAFLYRDSIERMSPNIFENLGKFSRENIGRMSQERLLGAVNAVLAAWTNWGVYDSTFLDDLHARFCGTPEKVSSHSRNVDKNTSKFADGNRKQLTNPFTTNDKPGTVSLGRAGRTELNGCGRAETDCNAAPNERYVDKQSPIPIRDTMSTDNKFTAVVDVDEEDPDGEPLDVDEEAEGSSIKADRFEEDPDGEAYDEDVDGEAYDDNPDGEELEEDVDGEELDEETS